LDWTIGVLTSWNHSLWQGLYGNIGRAIELTHSKNVENERYQDRPHLKFIFWYGPIIPERITCGSTRFLMVYDYINKNFLIL
jgi:hypothetical protein